MKSCIWSQNELGGSIYYSGCGSEWVMNDDCLPPIESGMHYCPFCGKELQQELWGLKADNNEDMQQKIGGLVDAWQQVPNDEVAGMREDSPELCRYLDEITAMVAE